VGPLINDAVANVVPLSREAVRAGVVEICLDHTASEVAGGVRRDLAHARTTVLKEEDTRVEEDMVGRNKGNVSG
jgi:hypothetical protein